MILEIIRDAAGFAALEADWDRLLDASTTHSPFLAWDYVRLWWQECGKKFKLCLGVVRDDEGAAVGIAPFVIGGDRGDSRQHLRHLGFINGLGDVQGERMDLLVPAGREAEITPLLASVISLTSSSWDVVRLNKVPEESANHSLLLAELRHAGVEAGVLNQSGCRYLNLRPTWEEFEKEVGGKFRGNIRRYWGRLFDQHEGSVVTDFTPEKSIEHFFRLHALHWPDGVSSFLRPAVRRLHERLMAKWLPTGRAMTPFIIIDGQPVGSIYALCHRGEVLIYQLGWDKRYASISMGNMAVRATLNEAIQRGFELVDFLPGEYRYKRDWSSRVRHVSDLECFHPWHLRSLAFRALRALKRRFAKPEAATTPAPAASTESEE
jgi:CelD/BcsL family acetyltransferase involved in cellulose biosynthesis